MKNLRIVLSPYMVSDPDTEFRDLDALAEALNYLNDEDSGDSMYAKIEVSGYSVAASGENGSLVSVGCTVRDGLASDKSRILWEAAAGTAAHVGEASPTFIDKLEAAGGTSSTLGPVSYGQWEFTVKQDTDGHMILDGAADHLSHWICLQKSHHMLLHKAWLRMTSNTGRRTLLQ